MKKILLIILIIPSIGVADLIPEQRIVNIAIENINDNRENIINLQKEIKNNKLVINENGELVIKSGEDGSYKEINIQEQLTKLEENLVKTTDRLNEVRDIVSDSPTINNEVRNIKNRIKYMEVSILSLKDNINAVSDLGKWFLGSLITITLGLFALLFPLAIKSLKSKA